MADGEAAEALVIRKYQNRRLYDATHSRYVNLKQIGEFIKQGERVQVVDATTGEDLTKVILTQIIIEEEKGQRNLLPIQFLHELIQYGEVTYSEFAEKMISAGLSAYRTAQEQVESTFVGWFKPLVDSLVPDPLGEITRLRARVAELEARLEGKGETKSTPPPA